MSSFSVPFRVYKFKWDTQEHKWTVTFYFLSFFREAIISWDLMILRTFRSALLSIFRDSDKWNPKHVWWIELQWYETCWPYWIMGNLHTAKFIQFFVRSNGFLESSLSCITNYPAQCVTSHEGTILALALQHPRWPYGVTPVMRYLASAIWMNGRPLDQISCRHHSWKTANLRTGPFLALQ